jgi:CTP synthase
LNDGGEVDLDLGNYERYLNVTLSRDNNITTGKIYREVIEKEVRACAASKKQQVCSYLCSGRESTLARRSRYVLRRLAVRKRLNTQQIVPHITNAIQDWIERVAKIPVDESGEVPDVCIVEVSTLLYGA